MEPTADDIKTRWGRRIAAKRDASGETQVQLADRVGLFPQTISRIERGQGAMDTFVSVANALGLDLVEAGE